MKKTIKLITLVITMLLLSTIALADSNITFLINNNQVNFNRLHNNQPVGEPFIENSRTYLPIRVVSEDLGYKVDWKQESKTAIITKGKTVVEITVGKSQALVNGVLKNIDVQDGVVANTKAMMVGGRTYVPVRFISEAMGDKVEYRHPSTSSVTNQTVYINCTNLPVETPAKPNKGGIPLSEAITNASSFKPRLDTIGTNPKVFYQNLPVQVSDRQDYKITEFAFMDNSKEALAFVSDGFISTPQLIFLKGNKMLGGVGIASVQPLDANNKNGAWVYRAIDGRLPELWNQADSIGLYHLDKNKLTIVPKTQVSKEIKRYGWK